MVYISSLFLSLFTTISLIPLLRWAALWMKAVDLPDRRKVHERPMPKTGGLAMALGALIPVCLWTIDDPFAISLLLGSGIIVGFGLLDDIRDLGYRAKFGGQIAAALLVVFYGGIGITSLGNLGPADYLLPPLLAVSLTLLVIVGVTNAINLSDGLDGLAGGISLLSFLCIAFLGYQTEQPVIVIFSLAIIGAIFGFLRFNTYPATIFMGDTGSQLIGFLAITLSIALTQRSAPLSPTLPLLLLGFPILDTVTVMTERLLKGHSPFQADKNHFHHKLMRLGLFHTEAVFLIYLLQALLVTVAYIFRYDSDWLLLLLYLPYAAVIVAGFSFADATGWQLKRYDLFDVVIKGKLRTLKEKNILIRFTFQALKLGFLLLLVTTAALPTGLPGYFVHLAIGGLGTLVLSLLFRPQWLSFFLGLNLYLLVPVVVFWGEKTTIPGLHEYLRDGYHILFLLVVLGAILTLKYTRRQQGFKISPMHFLIVFVALIIPNLPDQQIQQLHIGALAAKTIAIFFSYEVLTGELRENQGWALLAVLGALGAVVLRGM